ncbi:MAG: TlpA family protein disulfide reductase [Gemmatimonadaceae bacterium]|nr:TlpA family protein disulfide reductase [Gemmatimonadaceae bacterium]
MTVRGQWIIVAAVVTTMGAGLFAATRFLGDELFQVTIGSEAPNFSAVTLDATPLQRSIDSYKGEVVLLNIWATWCEPCRVEMPSIERLHSEFAARGLKVVAVSIDQPGMEEQIRGFAREYGLTFEILHNQTGDIQRQYQMTGVPETFVIGRDGIIHKKVIGAESWDSGANRALIEGLIEQRPS